MGYKYFMNNPVGARVGDCLDKILKHIQTVHFRDFPLLENPFFVAKTVSLYIKLVYNIVIKGGVLYVLCL